LKRIQSRRKTTYLFSVLVDIEKYRENILAKLIIPRYMMLSSAVRLEEFTSSFVHRLPKYMQEVLKQRETSV